MSLLKNEQENKKSTKSSNEKESRVTIKSEIYKLFDKKGLEKVTIEECITVAKRVKKDTKFKMSQLSYWRSKYRVSQRDKSE